MIDWNPVNAHIEQARLHYTIGMTGASTPVVVFIDRTATTCDFKALLFSFPDGAHPFEDFQVACRLMGSPSDHRIEKLARFLAHQLADLVAEVGA